MGGGWLPGDEELPGCISTLSCLWGVARAGLGLWNEAAEDELRLG